jgi:hypothetical protein
MNNVLMIAPLKFSRLLTTIRKKHCKAPALRFCGAAYLSDPLTGGTYDDELLWEMRIGQRSDCAFLPSMRSGFEQPGRRVIFGASVQRGVFRQAGNEESGERNQSGAL